MATSPLMRLRDREWPSPKEFVAPGDRFIPTRSLMNLDFAQSSLMERRRSRVTTAADRPVILGPKDEYRRRVEDNLRLDSRGKPQKMLVFRGSPRNSKTSSGLVEEMLKEDLEPSKSAWRIRRIPKSPERVLDAPELLDDFYLNLLDWGQTNILAVSLGSSVYLWNPENKVVQKLLSTNEDDYPSSVAWSTDGKMLAVGFASSRIEIWDPIEIKQVRILEGHFDRVGSLSWNQKFLSSGSRDKSIINHDVRCFHNLAHRLKAHSEEVCGLKWSDSGEFLASGGNDNLVHVWSSTKMRASSFLHRFSDHRAAVRALAWCPFRSHTLATGGGTTDQCIKIWNVQTGKCSTSINSYAQVCALEWNRHQKEILSAHGYSQNQLSLWTYPSLSKITDLVGHTDRVLHLSQSSDGSTVASAAADETIRFWKVFEPPVSASSRLKEVQLLSLKRMHIR
ncbi:cell division cycle 20.1, cofactor of APC complex-like [Curcuma longa]|uniref:cell division cycle 20.1, cofactor of APC complex-like n=1 Tax=Curcuma longa TaxID=136217 RepID=UPI003D9E79C4